MVAILAILAFATIASPAVAQESIEGFTLEECVTALAANSGFALSDAQKAELEALNVSGTTSVKQVFEALFDNAGDPEFVVAGDVTLGEICSIYGTNVLPTRFDRNGNGNGDGDKSTTVLRRKVTSHPVTGSDVLLLSLFGIGMLGLGYVALRRTRDQAS
jgi:LPXTG-motif cell wall-anchored protein